MNKATRKRLIRVGVFMLGALPVAWRVPVGKAIWTKFVDREAGNRHDGQTQFQKQDAVGVFRLGYVDCIPYSGPEQVIRIDEDGEVECVKPAEAIPGVTDGTSAGSPLPAKKLGRVRVGSILNGELDPEPGFISAAGKAAIARMKMQVVYLPGGPPGVWMAMSANDGERLASWDEIYVRPGFEPSAGVAT